LKSVLNPVRLLISKGCIGIILTKLLYFVCALLCSTRRSTSGAVECIARFWNGSICYAESLVIRRPSRLIRPSCIVSLNKVRTRQWKRSQSTKNIALSDPLRDASEIPDDSSPRLRSHLQRTFAVPSMDIQVLDRG